MPVVFLVGVDDVLQGADLPGRQAGGVQSGFGTASKQVIGADPEDPGDFDEDFVRGQAGAVFIRGYGGFGDAQ